MKQAGLVLALGVWGAGTAHAAARLSPVEEACWKREAFAGVSCLVPRQETERVAALIPLCRDRATAAGAYLRLAESYRALGRTADAARAMEYHVAASGRSQASLRALADFRGDALDVDGRIAVLRELAAALPAVDLHEPAGDDADEYGGEGGEERGEAVLSGPTAPDVHREIAAYALRHGRRDAADVAHRAIAALFPEKAAYRKVFVRTLAAGGRRAEALRELDALARAFPGETAWVCRTRSEILCADGRPDEAVAVYERELRAAPNESLSYEYIGLLSRLGRLSARKKALLARSRRTPSEAAELLFLRRFQGRHDLAQSELDAWVAAHSAAFADAAGLRSLAALFAAVGDEARACSALYTAWLADRSAENLDRLYWAVHRAEKGLPFGPGGMTSFFAADRFDADPGFFGGFLSLLLNDTGLRDRLREIETVDAAWANRRFAHRIFAEFRRRYPGHPLLPAVHRSAIETALLYGDRVRTVAWAREYLAGRPTDAGALDVRRMIARAEEEAGDLEAAWRTWDEILGLCRSTPELGRLAPAYRRAYIERLTERKEFLRVIALHWAEIRARPGEEALYAEFLAFIRAHDLFAEELKVYEEAFRRFRGPAWINRLARWYLDRRGDEAVKDLSRRIRATLDAPELEEYMREFRGSWDARTFAADIARYARDRFPASPYFTAELRTVLFALWGWGRNPEFEKPLVEACRESYWIDEGSRRFLMQYLSWKGTLRADVERLAGDRSATALRFSADGWAWLSQYERAWAPAVSLAAVLPGDEPLQSSVADLARSLGMSAEAAARYERLAALRPARTTWWTRAGEVHAEAGRYERAGPLWRNILKTGPADPAVWKETATLFWDYYRYEEALGVIREGRRTLGRPEFLAREAGVLLEGLGDAPGAVAEYLRALGESGAQASGIMTRLVYLSRRKGLGPVVEAAFRDAGGRGNARMVVLHGEYLARMGRTADRLALYAGALRTVEDMEALESFYNAFEAAGDRALTGRALERMAEVSREDRTFLRRLAAFHEEGKDWAAAAGAYGRMRERYRGDDEYAGVLADIKNFHLRRGNLAEAVGAMRETAAASEGPDRDRAEHELAGLLIRAGGLAEAGGVLAELLRRRPDEPAYFDTLAELAERRGDAAAMADLYAGGVRQIQSGGLSAAEKRIRIANLRRSFIRRLAAAGRAREALDQYIEILNRDPENAELLREVFAFADRAGLGEFLAGYYRKTAAAAGKDFRWPLVLGRIAVAGGDPAGAAAWFRAALDREPQRAALQKEAARVFASGGDYAAAAGAFRQAWRLEKSAAAAVDAARMYGRARLDAEFAGFVGELRSRGSPFVLARLHAELGEYDGAFRYAREGFAAARRSPGRAVVEREDAASAAASAVAAGRLDALLSDIAALAGALRRELAAERNFERPAMHTSLASVEAAVREIVPDEVREYGSAADRAGFGRWLAAAEGWDRELLIEAARRARLPGVEEAFLRTALEEARRNRSPWAVDRLVGFHLERLDFDAAAAVLDREIADTRWAPSDRQGFQYRRARVALFRTTDPALLAADEASELVHLRRCWNFTGGVTEGSFGAAVPPETRRLLELSWEREDRCGPLVAEGNVRTGALLDFLIARGAYDRCLETIARACAPLRRVWRDTRTVLVMTFFDRDRPAADGAFRRILNVVPVGRQLGVPVDRAAGLVGADWFVYARRYGCFLDRAGNPDADGWLAAEAEGGPLSAARQGALGDWETGRSRHERALARYRAAVSLAPRENLWRRKAGEALRALGRTEEAFAEWRRIVEKPGAGPDDYSFYAATLAEAGFADRAIAALRGYVLALYPDRMNLSQVRAALGGRGGEALRGRTGFRDLLREIAGKDGPRVEFCETVLAAGLAAGDEEFFHLAAVADLGAKGAPYRFRAQADEWRRRLAALYRSAGLHGKAVDLLSVYAGRRPPEEPAPEWAALELVRALSAAGRVADARREAAAFIASGPPDRALAVARVWEETGRTAERLSVLETTYRAALAGGARPPAESFGLAQVLFETGRAGEAAGVLGRMAADDPGDGSLLRPAAGLAARFGRTAEALAWRRRLAALVPGDDGNRLEVARLLAVRNETGAAAAAAAETALGGRASRSVRREAALLAGRLIASASAGEDGRRVRQRLASAPGSPFAAVALAAAARESGEKSAADALLVRAASAFPDEADVRLVRAGFLEEDGRRDEAAGELRAVLRLCRDDAGVRLRLFRLLAARVPGPRPEETVRRCGLALQAAGPLLPPGIAAYRGGAVMSGWSAEYDDGYRDILARAAPEPAGRAGFLVEVGRLLAARGEEEAAAALEVSIRAFAGEGGRSESLRREAAYRAAAARRRKEAAGMLGITADLANGGAW